MRMIRNQIPAHGGRTRFECNWISPILTAVKRHRSITAVTQRFRRLERATRHGAR